jgi:hypothetical protein
MSDARTIPAFEYRQVFLTAEDFEPRANALGAEGWELVRMVEAEGDPVTPPSVDPSTCKTTLRVSGWMTFWKRPRGEPPAPGSFRRTAGDEAAYKEVECRLDAQSSRQIPTWVIREAFYAGVEHGRKAPDGENAPR